MFAGILLGPSLLGWIAPQFSAYLIPAGEPGILNALSQVGVVIFMFLVGLGIDPKELKHQSHSAVLVSHVSITAPFVLASLLALYLYPRLSDDSVSFTNFALFMGAAMSVTAFPVLARILIERDLNEEQPRDRSHRLRGSGRCNRMVHSGLHCRAHPRRSRNNLDLGYSGRHSGFSALIMIYGVRFLLKTKPPRSARPPFAAR